VPVLKQKNHEVKTTNVWPAHIQKLVGAWKDLTTAEEIRIQGGQTKEGKKVRPK
jgi:hypothetical protein